MAFDGVDNVYITDRGNNRIQVFTESGEFLRQFGKRSRGQDRGELSRPAMITIDSLLNLAYHQVQCQ